MCGEFQQSIAILHDRMIQSSGSNRVVFEMARILDAPIYTLYCESKVDIPEDITVNLLKQDKYLSGLSSKMLRRNSTLPFEDLSMVVDMNSPATDLENFDIIIESGPKSKHYVPQVDQLILNYPQSPNRGVYDLFSDIPPTLDRRIIRFWVDAYKQARRIVDKEPIEFVDSFIANSEFVQDTIKKYYKRDSHILYPPISDGWYNGGDDSYYITWSRLDPIKRVPLIAEAFQKLDEELIIIGDGKDREKILDISENNSNINYLGYVEDIKSIVANSTAVVYAPKKEDFGLVGAEAQAAGKPLIGVNEGFTRYQVTQETGVTFEPAIDSLRKTVRNFNPNSFNSSYIQSQAEAYSIESFENKLEQIIQSEVDKQFCTQS